MTWKDILKKDDFNTRYSEMAFDRYKEMLESGKDIVMWPDEYEKHSWMLMRDFMKFLEDREFLRLTKEGIEVKEPFYVKDEKEDENMWEFLKSGDILIKGISYPFASYSLAIDKHRTIDGTENQWDGHIVHNELSFRDTKQVIHHFFTNHPNEKKKYINSITGNEIRADMAERFFAEELK